MCGRRRRARLLCGCFSRLTSCTGPIFNGENDLSDFQLVAFFYADIFDHSGYGGRNFNYGLVGFQFHHRLTFIDNIAGRDHQPYEVTLFDIFPELG